MPKNKKYKETADLRSYSGPKFESKPRRNWNRDNVDLKARAEPFYNPDLNINKKEKQELLKRLKGKKKAKASKQTKATTK